MKNIPWKNVKPDGLTNQKGEQWTGEVEHDCGKLWFAYRTADGNIYESNEEPFSASLAKDNSLLSR
jgi:hypothetical protein